MSTWRVRGVSKSMELMKKLPEWAISTLNWLQSLLQWGRGCEGLACLTVHFRTTPTVWCSVRLHGAWLFSALAAANLQGTSDTDGC